MFLPVRVEVGELLARNELAIRFASLDAVLAPRRPRARWRVARLAHRNLRWVRTSLLGRLVGAVPTPAPVGPWRPVRLVPDAVPHVLSRRLVASCPEAGDGGTVDVEVALRAGTATPAVTVDLAGPSVVAGRSVAATVTATDDPRVWRVRATVELDTVERWWPRTHGEQPLYAVNLGIDGRDVPLGRVGFRTVCVDETGGAFQIVVNDVPIFVRGACWTPVDPVSLDPDPGELERTLRLVVDGNLNMLRVSGDTVYESDAFHDLCDELGILVWQDCMLAFADPPADAAWEQSFLDEVRAQLGLLTGRPSVAVVSGGSEIAQQATYAGIALDAGLPLLTERLPAVVHEALGDVPYVPTSPWGGDVPTRPDTGVSHYYGVGAYLRGLEDARLAAPRFAAECLAFAVPPERATVDEAFGGPAAAGHRPDWKRAVFRDAGASWDFEDVRDHYVRELFGVDPMTVRYSDPERYLDLGRAACAHLYAQNFAEWRRARSSSSGGLVFYFRDFLPGAGMGLVDAYGRPKAPWYTMRRVLAPIAVTVSDEGLNGLVAHVHNDTGEALSATVHVDLYVDGELLVDSAEREVKVEARGSLEVGVDAMFDGFRDLAWSHRFGPLAYDVVVVSLFDDSGAALSQDVHLPGGLGRPFERDLGLVAEVAGAADASGWSVVISARRLGLAVHIDGPNCLSDNWFAVLPGRVTAVHVPASQGSLSGTVSAGNGERIAFRRDVDA
jgi:beta-mannosidase